jgi:hypothetical protein
VKKQKIGTEVAALDATAQALKTGALTLRDVYDFFTQWADQVDLITPEQQAEMIRVFGIVATWTPGQPLDIVGEIDMDVVSIALCCTPGHGETSTPIRSATP